jgi:hypothetical protein
MTNTSFLRFALMVLVLFGLLGTACRRNKDTDDLTIDLEQRIHASDDARQEGESSEALDDVESVLESAGSAMGGGKTVAFVPCGATIDSVTANRTYTLTFDGTTPCVDGTRTRAGVITFKLTAGEKWRDAGSVVTVTFTNYKVTRLADNRSVVLNGVKTLTNLSGGNRKLVALTANAELVVGVAGNLNLTFDDGSVRTWQISRKRTYRNLGNGKFEIRIEGTGSAENYTNLSAWGTTRFGGAFYTQITEPIVVNNTCGFGKPVSGLKVHHRPVRTITALFGTDQDGVAVTTGCPFGYKLTWEKATGNTKSEVIAY